MLYQLRRGDGSRDPHSSGTLVGADGRATHLAVGDFSLAPAGPTFKSKNGAVYPTAWTITVPSQKLDLKVTTPLDNQELSLEGSTGVAYWEGLIDVAGSASGKPAERPRVSRDDGVPREHGEGTVRTVGAGVPGCQGAGVGAAAPGAKRRCPTLDSRLPTPEMMFL